MSLNGMWGRISRKNTVQVLDKQQLFADHGVMSWEDSSLGVHARFYYNPENVTFKRLSMSCSGEELLLFFSGRIDNSEELMTLLKCGPSGSDTDLIASSYRMWGSDSAKRIYGDWNFAVWHTNEKKLFLARDHFGATGMYYFEGDDEFLFSNSRKHILDEGYIKPEFDELYLAQVIVSWMDYHGERTINKSIKRLPPAHTLTLNSFRTTLDHYWQPESVLPIRLKNRAEYIEAFREVFTEAVRCRLPSNGEVSLSLSSGLDSSSILSIASDLLASQDRRITAYTSVPLADTSSLFTSSYGDEYMLAKSTADFLGNVDIYPVKSENITPIAAIKEVLDIMGEPTHAAGNFFWLQSMREMVRDSGCKVLLMGQMGNGTISWEGDMFSQPVSYVLHKIGFLKYMKHQLSNLLPETIMAFHRKAKFGTGWIKSTAINPTFAKRINLVERRSSVPASKTAIQKRSYFKPGASNVGCMQAELSAAYNHQLRDPTSDARVIDFAFAIPDSIYIDPVSDTDRWLIREAMKNRIPEKIRLNTRLGVQGADRVMRLRSSAVEVESVMSALKSGPAAEYVDVSHMYNVWESVKKEYSRETFIASGQILLRGIMAGLFVNKFYGYSKEF